MAERPLGLSWPGHGSLETDVGVDAVEWRDPQHFELRLDLAFAIGGTQRVRGDVSGRAVVDTIRSPSP
jgi:hypothetical protein